MAGDVLDGLEDVGEIDNGDGGIGGEEGALKLRDAGRGDVDGSVPGGRDVADEAGREDELAARESMLPIDLVDGGDFGGDGPVGDGEIYL